MRFLASLFVFFIFTSASLAAQPDAQSATSPGGHAFAFMHISGTDKIVIDIEWPSDWGRKGKRNVAVPYVGTKLMLNGGTGDLTPAQLNQKLNDMHASGQIFVTADGVQGQLVVRKDKLDQAIVIVHDILAAPRFDPHWLKRDKDTLKENLEEGLRQSVNKCRDVARKAVLGDSPLYAFLSLDDPSVFDRVTAQDLRRWHNETFVASGVTIAVAGAISQAQAGKVIDKLFASLPAGPAVPPPRTTPDFAARTIVLHDPGAKKTMIGFVGPLPPTSQKHGFDDLVITRVLADDSHSRLFDAVRRKLHVTYGIDATTLNYGRHVRLFAIGGEVDPKHLAAARRTVLATYDGLRKKGVTAAEVRGLKTALTGNLKTSMTRPENMAASLLENALDGFPAERVSHLLDELDAVSVKAVDARLRDVYPAAKDLIQFVVSTNANAVPGACVIEAPDEVDKCR